MEVWPRPTVPRDAPALLPWAKALATTGPYAHAHHDNSTVTNLADARGGVTCAGLSR